MFYDVNIACYQSSRPRVLGKMQIYLVYWCGWFSCEVQFEMMVVYLELLTGFDVGDEHRSAIEQF